MTGGQVFTVFLCLIMGSFSMGAVTPYITAVTTARGAAVTVFEIIDKIPSIDAQSVKGIIVDSIQGNVEFRDVTFAYPTRSDIKILTKFNMVVKAGQTVALVGSSGSGKSTVINLLLRFYDPQFGKIIIDNFDIPSLAINCLRNLVAVVSQEPILFGCTIRENILYGLEDAKDSDIINVAKMANAHDFITQLPEGYNTLVGERGTQLSGGQKQRIAIARALIRNPRILLLDEATSALDAESEKAVQKALDRACEGRTTIIVAHRLSTIQNADVIYVMDKGQIVETGQHMNLMKMKGIYYQMASLQTFQGDGYGDKSEEIEAGDKSPEKLVRTPSWRLDRKLSHQLSLIETKEEAEEEEDLGFEKPGFCRMLRTNSPEWYFIIIGVIASMGNGTIMAIFSIIYGELFKTFSYPPNEMAEKSFLWAMVFLGLGGANFFTQVGMSAGLGISGERLTKRLRLQTFQNIVRQDIGWFDDEKHQTGKLTFRLGTDAPLVKGATGSQLSTILSALATLIIGLTLSFYYGWKLSLVVLATGPIATLAGMLEMKALGAMQQKDTSVMESAGKSASEAIENIRTVQALTREKTFYDIYCHHLLIPYRKRLNKAQVYGLSYGFSQGSFFFLYAVAFYYGGYLVVHNEMSADAVFRVFFGMAFSAMSVGQSFAFLPDYAKAKVAAGHIFHLMDEKPIIDSASSFGEKQQIKGTIIFRNVSFSYPMRPDVTVLKNISFSINPGQTLALVGTSGCGKSTVVALLERFYNPKSGSILLDGYEIDKINVNWLRSHISLVSQEPVLFNCSIRDNIVYGIDGFVSDDVISNVAQIANIHDFIVSLPQGYDTMVGEKGTQLSGGQKQRIAIARALIRNPKVLLLDEATSALDSESEKLVQEALNAASAGRTCLVIAHRLSTIQNANVIAVIDNGEIVEQGTHQELVQKQGVYYKLTHSQMIS